MWRPVLLGTKTGACQLGACGPAGLHSTCQWWGAILLASGDLYPRPIGTWSCAYDMLLCAVPWLMPCTGIAHSIHAGLHINPVQPNPTFPLPTCLGRHRSLLMVPPLALSLIHI